MTQHNDIGAHLGHRFGGVASIVAAGGGDDVEVEGPYHDRVTPRYHSVVLAVAWEATLGDGETLSLALAIQQADDAGGTNAEDLVAASSVVVATGPGGGGTVQGVTTLKTSLETAKGFVGAKFTPDLSAGATDVATLGASLIFGGADVLPAA